MSFNYKLTSVVMIDDVEVEVKKYNSDKLPDRMINKLVEAFKQHNQDAKRGDAVEMPILPMYFDKYDDLINKGEPRGAKPVEAKEEDGYRVGAAHPVRDLPHIETNSDVTEIPAPEPEPEPVPEVKQKKQPVTEREHSEPGDKMKYRVYEYTFSRPGETIEAVLRLYNDMNLSRALLNKLLYIFTQENTGSLPPRLGQTVNVPVLLPFCYRHENNNKIFKDGK